MPRTPAQRAYQERLNAARAALAPVACACGCGSLIPPINKNGEPAKFKHGHNKAQLGRTGGTPWNKGVKMGPSPKRGLKLPVDQIAKRTATRRQRLNGMYFAPGRSMTDRRDPVLWRERLIPPRPRFGPENPSWEGGRSFLPYSPDFNRDLKRAILRRDKYTCQDCGHAVGRRKGARRVNIHHIDFDKLNTSEANLVALCVPCHAGRHWDHRKRATATA